MSCVFGKRARDKEWAFTSASLPRFYKGSNLGVLVCHGFGCTPSTMRGLYDTAVGRGCSASLPLLTGHAKTLGELEKASYEDWRRDVGAAYDKLAEAGCDRIILCGLSLGALLMTDLAARRADDPRLAGVFLICPPIKMKGYLNFSAAIAPLIPYVQTADGFINGEFELYYGMATRKLKDIRAMSKLALEGAVKIKCPVSLVRAENDSRVNIKSYDMLKKRLPQAKLVEIKGAPHGIPYSDKSRELCDVFDGFLAGL